MKFRMTYLLTAALLGTACGAADDPYGVAEAFWTASKDGDMELAKSYIAEGGSASIDESGSSIGDFSLGETAIDGDRATVETTMVSAGEQSMELAFTTVLVQQGGGWKVDLDQTSDEMMKSLFGTSMGGLVEKMGEAMGDAMQEMVEGMAEGFKAATQTLVDSLQGGGR